MERKNANEEGLNEPQTKAEETSEGITNYLNGVAVLTMEYEVMNRE